MSKIEPVATVVDTGEIDINGCHILEFMELASSPHLAEGTKLYDQSAIDELRGIIERLVGVLEDMGDIPCWPNTRLIEEAREILK